MKKLNLIQSILSKTNHTIESLAEILSLEAEDLLPYATEGEHDKPIEYDKHVQDKLKLLADFLAEYGLYC